MVKSLIFNSSINSLTILILVSFEKKLSIDWTWVSPIPSKSARLFKNLKSSMNKVETLELKKACSAI